MDYKVVSVPKGKGKYRKIYIPSESDRERLRSLLPELESILSNIECKNVNYAFQKGRNCALHAFRHIGYEHTLSMDLENFFESVSETLVRGLIPKHIIDECFIDGAPQQGLPTSPIISSIAFSFCDKKILNALNNCGISAVYTRYADDLVFSFNDRQFEAKIKHLVRQVVESAGFKLNDKKTKLQSASNGRVIITGVAIDRNGLHASRRTNRKIRAAIHQKNIDSAKGLVEWSRCKFPNKLFE